MRDTTAEQVVAAADLIAMERVHELARGWLARGNAARTGPGETDPDGDPARVAEALRLAMDLVLFAPSASGATASDRLARARRATKPHEVAALEALRRAKFRLLRVETVGTDGCVQLRDLASDQRLLVVEKTVPVEAVGLAVAARLAPMADGRQVFAGIITALDV